MFTIKAKQINVAFRPALPAWTSWTVDAKNALPLNNLGNLTHRNTPGKREGTG
jgi:hypothetical protein